MSNARLNMRQERFCLGLAEGLPQSRAYIEAGYTARGNAAEVEASKMVRLPKVATRIAELRADAARRSEITVDDLVAELNLMLKLALATKNPAAGVTAVMGKAKLLGLIIDKAEVDTVLRKPARSPTDDTRMSLEEWEQRFKPNAGSATRRH
ncbi:MULTISPECIES: terminase small subunit [unclassified Mesorhizobium]|uniref:terminase small subunit n=1 Tax=unclassified Mesorhizobium TaxID=325217 RepID=UPI001127B63B|nr:MULTISPECIES: terminase small subunit [unclassified Mesorhizobium]MBZ9954306.1 terminase small subunit [Mesorhizobium sp. BR1-1-15]TPJ61257.1 Terminase small subunit [Mesorhizobium sp. B2-6-1]